MTTTEIIQHETKDEGASLVDVIARAATDPATDVDKLERLMGMYERITARQAEAAFYEALAAMQPELPIIEKRGAIKNKAGGKQAGYARWEDVVEQVTPILSRHGFSLNFHVRHDGDRIVVTGILGHRLGHKDSTDSPPLMADVSGSKNAVQALGSSVSYGKRYAAFALLNIVARDEDDDGAAAGAGATISAEQFMELRNLMEEAEADERKFLAWLGVENLEELPRAKHAGAVAKLRQKIARDQREAANA